MPGGQAIALAGLTLHDEASVPPLVLIWSPALTVVAAEAAVPMSTDRPVRAETASGRYEARRSSRGSPREVGWRWMDYPRATCHIISWIYHAG